MSIEQKICGKIKEITGNKEVQLNDNLRDIGLDSINFIKIIVEIESDLDVEFPDELLIFGEYLRIIDLSEKIGRYLV